MLRYLDLVLYGEVTVSRLLLALGIFLVSLVLLKLFSIQLRRALKDKLNREHLELLSKIFSYAIVVVALLWILPVLGVELSGLLVAGGIVGLAIGFASQRIVGNLISGLFLIVERPIKLGDQVEIDGTAGFVEDIRIISTTIRTYDGLFVRIPNETIFTSKITNYVGHVARRFEYRVGIRYEDDADKAIETIHKVIDDHPLALVQPAPIVFVDSLGENSVDIVARIWAPVTDWFAVRMELLWRIKKALKEEGIQIPFPQRVVWFGKEPSEDMGQE